MKSFKEFLNERASVSKKTELKIVSYLADLVRRKKYDMLQDKINDGVDIDSYDTMYRSTGLQNEVVQNRIDLKMVKFLVSNGADVNQLDKENNTLLHLIMIYSNPQNNIPTINYLIKVDSPLNNKNKDALTPLDCFIRRGFDLDSEHTKKFIEMGFKEGE